MDFDDLLTNCVYLPAPQSGRAPLLSVRCLTRVLVDEYQDTNVAQFLLVKLLAAVQHNIFVVGDDDQSNLCVARGAGGKHPDLRKVFPGTKDFYPRTD